MYEVAVFAMGLSRIDYQCGRWSWSSLDKVLSSEHSPESQISRLFKARPKEFSVVHWLRLGAYPGTLGLIPGQETEILQNHQCGQKINK